MTDYRWYVSLRGKEILEGEGALGCLVVGIVTILLGAIYFALGGLVAMFGWNFIMGDLIGGFRDISLLEGVGLWLVLSVIGSILRGRSS